MRVHLSCHHRHPKDQTDGFGISKTILHFQHVGYIADIATIGNDQANRRFQRPVRRMVMLISLCKNQGF